MSDEKTWCKLVELAQHGQSDYMDKLVEQTRGRLCAYVYRVTLDHDITEDITQDILIQMVQSLDYLNNKERFWPWLYRIAQSKITEFYKLTKRKKLISKSTFHKELASKYSSSHQADGMRQIHQEELSIKVMSAMKMLKKEHRAVLSLRCFEDLSYADIALAMECSEVTARVSFCRAKKAIRKKLSHLGVNKSMLLLSLGLFGKLTAPTKAASSAISITAASTKAGPTATVIAAVSSKVAIVTATVLIILSIITGITLFPEFPTASATPSLPARNDINSFHFTVQLMDGDTSAFGSLNSKGAYERWFSLPDGIDGPMFMRMQRYTTDLSRKQCAWLENGQGNYYYENSAKIVYIQNARVCWSNLKVRRLPTDSKEFLDFLSEAEGEQPSERIYVHDEKTGLVTSSVDNRFVNISTFNTVYEFNTLNPQEFEYKWPETVEVIDQRDQMHKRGWTYLNIDGQINGRRILGQARIPFIYDTYKDYSPWLKLQIDNNLEIIDCADGAQLRDNEQQTITSYPVGTFFKGLLRPWMGTHTADIIRRDAAEKQIFFTSQRLEENEEKVNITLSNTDSDNQCKLVYLIDMEKDILESISFHINDEINGLLNFSYIQDISTLDTVYDQPALENVSQSTTGQGNGILWLFDLAK